MIKTRTAASREDRLTCADIWLASSLKAHDFVDAAFWQRQHAAMVDSYLPSGRVVMAFEDEICKGFSAVRESMLEAMFVRPEYWRQGVGLSLLRLLQETYDQLELKVYAKNTRALNFYRHAGFVILGETICPHTGEPELHMRWRKLAPLP